MPSKSALGFAALTGLTTFFVASLTIIGMSNRLEAALTTQCATADWPAHLDRQHRKLCLEHKREVPMSYTRANR